jgi:hypothetical protein
VIAERAGNLVHFATIRLAADRLLLRIADPPDAHTREPFAQSEESTNVRVHVPDGRAAISERPFVQKTVVDL